jgi:pyruvate/2-oxoglutarate dehydrogenase complex dihydrolipoamide dehydrogenase (E3) component
MSYERHFMDNTKTTSNFSLSDAPGPSKIMLAHVASTEGLVAAENAMGIKAGCTVTDLTETIHAHPTLSEILLEVSFKSIDMALHG